MRQNTPLNQGETIEEQVKDKYQTPLSVQLIHFYLTAGKTQADIADICGVTPGAVCHYITRHSEELDLLRDITGRLAVSSALNAGLADRHLYNILSQSEQQFQKHDLIALNIVSGTAKQRYLELIGKAPQPGQIVIIRNIINADAPQDVGVKEADK